MKKILIIEDEWNIYELIKFNLEKQGFEVDGIQDGGLAIEKILDYQPDLILLDLILYKMHPNISKIASSNIWKMITMELEKFLLREQKEHYWNYLNQYGYLARLHFYKHKVAPRKLYIKKQKRIILS